MARHLSKGLGRDAQYATHMAREMTLMCKSGLKGDLAYRQLILAKQGFRALDPATDEVLMNRQAQRFPEEAFEM